MITRLKCNITVLQLASNSFFSAKIISPIDLALPIKKPTDPVPAYPNPKVAGHCESSRMSWWWLLLLPLVAIAGVWLWARYEIWKAERMTLQEFSKKDAKGQRSRQRMNSDLK
ncbi:hypothetical protein [Bradyrhizobium lablabi]|uniref:hypothetical protein n=1 Tax=Bradyrhizobium lablabi TaxID=722472 RepID=UPI0012ABF67E|nr:hypothetical protein [Bradyrhizobium lablabi]